ncbi:ribonuclease HII [Mesoplasma corruscae]|uniref:Ribonuclease HII n=1 Tax=Mesoplasma corruscae TaxID=216874 RepID=A0A2S5RHL7_9MOLU|nr:ribonuclease HII [Mesoplasma corruscae]PPE06803.1 ribonuclease HII [Mesoplasma corruscae]
MIDKSRIEFDLDIQKTYHTTLISGSDEAGRGAMAGPIVVASVILPSDYANPLIQDSKKLSKKSRFFLFNEIKENAVSYYISVISNDIVDNINPKKASINGIKESILNLSLKPDVCLIDAEKVEIDNYFCLPFIKGDDKSQSIAAASILAKVTRDQIMIDYDKKYPNYGFANHKGYCTKMHQNLLFENGVTPIHRLSYKPVKIILGSLK